MYSLYIYNVIQKYDTFNMCIILYIPKNTKKDKYFMYMYKYIYIVHGLYKLISCIYYIYIQIHTYVADQGPKILEFGTTTVNLLLTLAPRFQGETPCWKLVQKFGSEART